MIAPAPPAIRMNDRSDWEDFPADGFPVTGTLTPADATWSSLVGQVWNEDFSQLIIDNIDVTFDGPGGTWSIDSDFTGGLTSATTYQLQVNGDHGATPCSVSHAFTMA